MPQICLVCIPNPGWLYKDELALHVYVLFDTVLVFSEFVE